MSAYYNESEPFAAQWLKNLIAAGHIAPGDVDQRSIVEVQPDDVRGYTQAHFFAGIGVWSHALRLAGWDDDRPVWTGSCPCQPFSAAGRGDGFDDERHLWPVWQRLIAECRPPAILGEQVASKAAEPWIDLVQYDLEGLGYAVGAVPIPAAGIGAPHIRDRLWWVADAAEQRSPAGARKPGRGHGAGQPERPGLLGLLALPAGAGPQGRAEPRERAGAEPRRDGRDDGTDGRLAQSEHGGRQGRDAAGQGPGAALPSGRAGGVADAGGGGVRDGGRGEAAGPAGGGSGEAWQQRLRPDAGPACDAGNSAAAGPLHGFWASADWLLCRDGKWRPVEPGTFPLANGVAGRVAVVRPGVQSGAALQEGATRYVSRVGTLRGAGNAIVAPLAAEFIAVVMECRP